LLEYDDVSNDQRKVIYHQRNELLETDDISETITAMRQSVIAETFRLYVPEESVEEQWDMEGLERRWLPSCRSSPRSPSGSRTSRRLADEEILARITKEADEAYQAKVDLVGADSFHQFERNVMLQSLDTHWREHLAALDHLRQGIHLRGYAQKNPKQEYKREAFELFEGLLDAGAQRSDPHRLHRADPFAGRCRGNRTACRRAERPVPARRYDEALGEGDFRRRLPASNRPMPVRRSVATIPVPAVPARNTSTATEN
jgi:preprotein translocase subunit SecA